MRNRRIVLPAPKYRGTTLADDNRPFFQADDPVVRDADKISGKIKEVCPTPNKDGAYRVAVLWDDGKSDVLNQNEVHFRMPEILAHHYEPALALHMGFENRSVVITDADDNPLAFVQIDNEKMTVSLTPEAFVTQEAA